MGNEIENLDPERAIQNRSSYTKYNLVLATLRLIGKQGYKATSTREISTAAGVNLAAIGYHYGSKNQLRLVVAKSVAAHMRKHGPGSAAGGMTLADIRNLSPAKARTVFKNMAAITLSSARPSGLGEDISRYFQHEFNSGYDEQQTLS